MMETLKTRTLINNTLEKDLHYGLHVMIFDIHWHDKVFTYDFNLMKPLTYFLIDNF